MSEHDPIPDPDQQLEDLLAEHREAPEKGQEPESRPFDPFAPVEGAGAATGGDAAAHDTAEEEDGPEETLPDAPLFALLRTVEAEVLVERIDRIWVFPPRRLEIGETSLVVVSAFPEIDADRRRVFAAHYTAPSEATEPTLALAEYGTAPTDRVGRLVEEVVERIKDGPAGAPRSYAVEGDPERWHAVLHGLAEAHLEETQKDRRIR